MKNLQEKINAILEKLGLAEKAKKKQLTSEEAAKINAAYKEEYKGDLNADLAAAKKGSESAETLKEMMAGFEAIGIVAEDTTTEDPKNEDETEEDKKKKKEDEDGSKSEDGKCGDDEKKKAAAAIANVKAMAEENKQLKAEKETMKAEMQKLAAKAAPDTAETKAVPSARFGGAHTDKYAFGIPSPYFATDKRYNRVLVKGRAVILDSDAKEKDQEVFKADFKEYAAALAERIDTLHKTGQLALLKIKGEDNSIDYSDLKNAGLGEQFVIRRMDALIARVEQLPSLDGTFPMRSNIQDKDMMTSVYLNELSQAYQEGHLSKGGATFKPEKAEVNDVMMKYLIKSFKWMETTYLGYLNTSGSDPIKWNMIEWLVLAMSTELQRERVQRMIRGCRVEPVEGKNGHYLTSATGLLHRLVSYVLGYKVLPFDDVVYQSYTSETIGDVLMQFAEAVNEVLDNGFLGKALYINDKHIPWYKAWYNTKYGKDTDYTGNKLMLKDYDLPIIGVPAMGNSFFMFITDEGNFQQLENKPGEMLNIKFQQDMESIWAFSYWKDGFAATYSGKPYATLAALTAAGRKFQSIFCNYPASSLTADDTTPDVSKNFLFKSVANTKATAITDLKNAQEGRVYVIEVGSETNPISIAKEGKFANISEAFTPTKAGSYIKLTYDSSTELFREVERRVIA